MSYRAVVLMPFEIPLNARTALKAREEVRRYINGQPPVNGKHGVLLELHLVEDEITEDQTPPPSAA